MSKQKMFDFNQGLLAEKFPSEDIGKLILDGGACYGISLYWMNWFAANWGQNPNFQDLLIQKKEERQIVVQYTKKCEGDALYKLFYEKKFQIESSLNKNPENKNNYDPINGNYIFGKINNLLAYKERQKLIDSWGASLKTPLIQIKNGNIIKFIQCDIRNKPLEPTDDVLNELVNDILKLHGKSTVIGTLGFSFYMPSKPKSDNHNSSDMTLPTIEHHAINFAYKENCLFDLIFFDSNYGQYKISGLKNQISDHIKSIFIDNYKFILKWWWCPMTYLK